MASTIRTVDAGEGNAVAALVAADGTLAQAWPAKLSGPGAAARDLSDAIHLLAAVHGRHPGIADIAVSGKFHPEARGWLTHSAETFAAERQYLVRLAAAAGPAPSTPGQPETDLAITAQCHALTMLAESERVGCATGAALALALDWNGIRAVLDRAAERFGMEPTDYPIQTKGARDLASHPGVERAMAFGAQQLLAQHRGLWKLLAARAEARDAL